MIVGMFQYPGLRAMGEVGSGPGQYLVHECYPQLHLHHTKYFKTFYDTFAMKTVRTLQGAPQRRLSPKAEKLVKRYGWWYIQFQKFTYIRIAGSTCCLIRLPRYPPNK